MSIHYVNRPGVLKCQTPAAHKIEAISVGEIIVAAISGTGLALPSWILKELQSDLYKMIIGADGKSSIMEKVGWDYKISLSSYFVHVAPDIVHICTWREFEQSFNVVTL